jgi:formyl-CoA transferase
MVLDFKKERGKNIRKRIIKKSDALVENCRLNVKKHLGIAYEDVKPLNQRLVYTSIWLWPG